MLIMLKNIMGWSRNCRQL